MKKITLILLTLLLTFGLCACGGSGDSTASDESGNSSSAEASQFPMVVEDNDYFTFEILDNDDFWGDYSVRITNKTDNDYTFSCDKAVVNGDTTIDFFIYSEIAANTKAKETFYLSQEDVGDYKNGEELNIEFKYDLTNSNFDNIKSGTCSFTLIK